MRAYWSLSGSLGGGDRGRSGAAPFVYAIGLLGAVGVLVITWRARRRTAAT